MRLSSFISKRLSLREGGSSRLSPAIVVAVAGISVALYDTGAKSGGTYNTTNIPEADVAPAGLGVVVQNTSTNPVQTKTVT